MYTYMYIGYGVQYGCFHGNTEKRQFANLNHCPLVCLFTSKCCRRGYRGERMRRIEKELEKVTLEHSEKGFAENNIR